MRVEVLRVSHPYTLHELREEGLLPKGGGGEEGGQRHGEQMQDHLLNA